MSSETILKIIFYAPLITLYLMFMAYLAIVLTKQFNDEYFKVIEKWKKETDKF